MDFEFSARSGERPVPVCVVARELRSRKQHTLWQDELCQRTQPPYATGSDALLVGYYASAEVGCHVALGWPVPAHVLDLFAEFRNHTNGTAVLGGNGLMGALEWFGLDMLDAVEKDKMRELAQRGGPWTNAERSALIHYCTGDVDALERLLIRMAPLLDIPRALLRGRSMTAAASIEHVGVPIDTLALATLRREWSTIQDRLIARVDETYRVFNGRSFSAACFERWLTENAIPWPRLPSGKLVLDDDTFREMARAFPAVAPLRELRFALSKMRLNDLTVGSDGRNRVLLSAFQAKTGRNQPSNTRFIFGPAVFLRGLIRPEPGQGLAYVDWEQQEFGVAAALSHDPKMIAAYESGDPYLAFAQQAGAAPPDATKQTHGIVREQFKAAALAVQYGMGEDSLAQRLGVPMVRARELLRLHHETYPVFWRWSDAAVDYAMLNNSLHTVFGWTIHIGAEVNPRSLRNFPMQANGSEMLRLACCFATEAGIRVCAPVHDALLIEAPIDELELVVANTQAAMARASAAVLGGFTLRTEAKLVRHPDRYMDERGVRMWDMVWEEIRAVAMVEPEAAGAEDLCTGASGAERPCTPALSYLSLL